MCYNPNHPWGTPICPAFSPHTSTPLPSCLTKLNQRAAQIWGYFWVISSRLGDPAPAPFRSHSGALSLGSRDAHLFPLPFVSHPSPKVALVVMFPRSDCSFVPCSSSSRGHMTFPIWLPPWQAPRGRKLTLAIRSVHSGSFAMTPKWS